MSIVFLSSCTVYQYIPKSITDTKYSRCTETVFLRSGKCMKIPVGFLVNSLTNVEILFKGKRLGYIPKGNLLPLLG